MKLLKLSKLYLSRIKHFFVFTILTLSLNVSSTDNTQQFNKQNYLDFSKPYTYNWNHPQSYYKQENQTTTLLKEVGGTVRNALGSTDSDNVNQLGDKIITGITNQLKNKAINATKDFINDEANEFANQFGSGRTQISIKQIESKNPTYSIKTIQPLHELNDNSADLVFVQGQLSTGENHGERRETLNLGVGYRKLLEQGQSIVGANLFTDYENNSEHARVSFGLEYQRANFGLNINSYHPI